MDKSEVAAVLEEIGLLLELKGENAFKTRAYKTAAKTMEGLTEDLGKLVAEDRLATIPGVGRHRPDLHVRPWCREPDRPLYV